MSELEVLRRVERLARDVKMNTYSVLSDRAKCAHCGEPPFYPRGMQDAVRGMLTKSLRELELAFVELDLLRAGAGPSS